MMKEERNEHHRIKTRHEVSYKGYLNLEDHDHAVFRAGEGTNLLVLSALLTIILNRILTNIIDKVASISCEIPSDTICSVFL